MTLTETLKTLDSCIDVEITWAENDWRPVDPEGDGVAIAWSVDWLEDNPLHDGPEPMGDEGALDALLPRVTEILTYPELRRDLGIRLSICGWALMFGVAA